jgi:hypothetical protein
MSLTPPQSAAIAGTILEAIKNPVAIHVIADLIAPSLMPASLKIRATRDSAQRYACANKA